MKTIVTTEYQCELCGMKHYTAENAIACERVPLNFFGISIGDRLQNTIFPEQIFQIKSFIVEANSGVGNPEHHLVYLKGFNINKPNENIFTAAKTLGSRILTGEFVKVQKPIDKVE